VLCFQRVLERHSLTFLDLLIVICAAPDFSPLIPVNDAKLLNLSQELEAMPSSLSLMTQENLQQVLCCSANQLLKVIHTAMILRHWTQIGDVETVAQGFQVPYPIEVVRGVESATRLLNALGDIANTIHLKPAQDYSAIERIEVLKQMIEGGLDEDAITLARVPGIGASRAKLMKKCGIRDVEGLAKAEISTLLSIPGIALKRAEEYLKNAGILASQIKACRDQVPTADDGGQNGCINLLGLLMQGRLGS